MKRVLWIIAVVTFTVSVVAAVWIDLGCIRWEEKNKGFVAVVRAEETAGIPLSDLADVGVGAIAVRASSLRDGRDLYLEAVRREDLAVALALDRPVPVEAGDLGPFTLVWPEGNLPADDPLLITLLEGESTLLLREFAESTCERTLWDAGFRRVVRGHEIPLEDLEAASREATLARFKRAVRERGIRCLILSPIPGDGPTETLQYYGQVIAWISEAGYHMGDLSLPPPELDQRLGLLLHLGICALLLLVLLRLFGHLPLACLLLTAGVASLALGVRGILLHQVDALLLALLAPVYGTLLLVPRVRSGWRSGARLLLLFSAGSFVACVLLAAILSHPAFLVKVAGFRGVKVALLLPPLVGVILHSRQSGWEGVKDLFSSSGRTRAGKLLKAGLIGASLVAAGLILLRSGNADALVSGLEERARGLLEGLLVARPRFKEFLIGHPLLFLFGTNGRSGRLRPFLLFFGLVGQVSILNTFAHAHTPLLLSILRTGNGLLLGITFGTGLYVAVSLAKSVGRRIHQRK